MSQLIDKLVVFLLIIILPVSIYVSSQLDQKSHEDQVRAIEEEKISKINEAIKKMEANKQAELEKLSSQIVPPITIEAVNYYKDKNEIKVEGTAPGTNLNVMISSMITKYKDVDPVADSDDSLEASTSAEASASSKPQKPIAKVAEDINVLGESVEVKAVKSDDVGKFSFIKKIDDDVALLELRFDQADSTATVQWDFIENKRKF